MKLEKKRRLEATGWKETTLQEFLNLSEADAQYIETKLALSRRLRQLREERHLTQTKVASLLKRVKAAWRAWKRVTPPSPWTSWCGGCSPWGLHGRNWGKQRKSGQAANPYAAEQDHGGGHERSSVC